MTQIKCPSCNSLKAQKIRRMWRKGKTSELLVVEGMQMRCSNPECRRYFVSYPETLL